MIQNTKKAASAAARDAPEAERETKRLEIIVGLICVVVGIFICGLIWYYSDRALPNITVGGVPAGQKSRDELRQIVQHEADAMNVTFIDGGKSTTVPAKSLGVTVDREATVSRVLRARRAGSLAVRLAIWRPQQVPLVLDNDAGVLKEYIMQHFASAFVDAKDAHLSFNDATSQFDVSPSATGKGFDIKSFETALPDIARQPRSVSLALSTTPTQPLISTSAATAIQAVANQQIKLTLQFQSGGSTIYTVQPSEIASWMHFIPDPTKGTIRLEYDKAKLQQFLDQKVGATIAAAPVDRKVLVDPNTGSQYVLQTGSPGKQLQEPDRLADAVMQSLTANQPLTKEVSVADAPFKTITMTGSAKWVEVDLTQQRTTLYSGNTAIQSFTISSGTAVHPTIPGEYHIWYKVASQTMTERSNVTSGDYFYLPNVKWISYFDGDRAFHGTYWHHNFGHPMSHGCINMTEADAKILYDFAPVGTRVVVHT